MQAVPGVRRDVFELGEFSFNESEGLQCISAAILATAVLIQDCIIIFHGVTPGSCSSAS